MIKSKLKEPKFEYVILVDEKNNELGTAKKSEVHKKETPLHRAFSCFIFNEKNELLLQQRAKTKKTWPLIWSNSVCGHPKINETNVKASIRRTKDELGCKIKNIEEMSPYRYKASKNEIQENEICPILVAKINSKLNLNKKEVENTKWINWNDWLEEILINKEKYSIWCIEETKILSKLEKFNKYLKI